MKLNSFRLRIAVLSSLLAGVALVSFGLISGWLIYQTKLSHIDDSIKDQLMRESDRPRPGNHWPNYITSLPITFGTNTTTDLALLVKTPTGETVYQSATWTPELMRRVSFPPASAIPQPQQTVPPPFPPPDRPPLNDPEAPPPPDLSGPDQPLKRPPLPPEDAPGRLRLPGQLSRLVTQTTATGTWRVGAVTAADVQIAIGVNLRSIDTEMNPVRNVYLVTIPVMLVLIAIAAWWLSGKSLRPIRQVTSTLRRVTAKGLDQRVPVGGAEIEFVELLQVFNQMMERLERSFNQASRFSADAAHELKTPLSILQGELERTLQAAPPGSELQQRLSSLLDEVGHLSAIVRKLLLLSLADAGQMRLHTSEVNLSELLANLIEDIDLLAPDLTVQVQIEPGLKVQADQSLLIQVLQNLISNAIKYNLPTGWIRVEAGRRNWGVFVTVTNASQDISAAERSRIFDRFHRGEAARTRSIEGLGLGLSLSREIACAHGGNLTLDPTPRGQTAFTLSLSNRDIP